MTFLDSLFPAGDNLTKLLRRISRLADRNEVPVYLVGGVVRDRLLGRDTKDVDITVIGDGIAFARQLARTLKVPNIVEYQRFGTAMVPCA